MDAEKNETPDRPPGTIARVLWWCATAIPEIMSKCRSDGNRASIIGMGTLFTFLYATIAWIYFWSINSTNPWLYIGLGLFMGFGILTIDRMLIASIKAGKVRLVPTAFRVVLAIALGAFIAQPVILWLFQEDLQAEVQILQDEKLAEKNAGILQIKDKKNAALEAEQAALLQQQSNKYADVNQARQTYQAEIDGTGGSQRYGIRAVAKEKLKILERQEEEYLELQANTRPRLDTIAFQLAQIESDYQQELKTYKEEFAPGGFLIQVSALQSLLKKDPTGSLRERYWLLLFILILFELIPIIAKIFLPTGTYDHQVALQDEWELRSSQSAFEKKVELFEAENTSIKTQDLKLMKDYFSQSEGPKKQKSKEHIDTWMKGNGASKKDLWTWVRDEVLNKRP